MERTYVIKKDPKLGYGFIIGNDQPTIVKYVVPEGPSSECLLLKDVIVAVNGVRVENALREQIVRMVELSDNQLEITVKQMEEEMIKIFSELGNRKVLKYSVDATVGDLLEILNEKFLSHLPYFHQVKKYFGIILTYEVGNTTAKKIYTLNENDSITKLKQLEYAPKLRLIYRMINPPTDISGSFKREKFAFEYLYQQSCNDLKIGRFRPELDEESAYKLSALHLLEYVYTHHAKAHENGKNPDAYLDMVEKELGLKDLIAESLREKILDKKKKKINNSTYKKVRCKLKETLISIFEVFDPKDAEITTLGEHMKLLFLNYLSQLACYGSSERPPVGHNSPSSISSSLDRTSDSLSLIRPDDSATNNYTDKELEARLKNRIEIEEQFLNQPSDNHNFDQNIYPKHNLNDYNNNIECFNKTMSISSNKINNNNLPQFHRRASERYCNNRFENRQLTRNNDKFHTRSNERLQQETISLTKLKVLNETLRTFIQRNTLPPPPPPTAPYDILTRVMSDKDIEKLLCPPPPPPMMY